MAAPRGSLASCKASASALLSAPCVPARSCAMQASIGAGSSVRAWRGAAPFRRRANGGAAPAATPTTTTVRRSSEQRPAAPTTPPAPRTSSSSSIDADADADASSSSTATTEDASSTSNPWVAPLIALAGVAALLGGGYAFRDQIRAFLDFFIGAVDEWGPWGYAAYAAVYAGLEILAVPAIPLTMTAGIIFGPLQGTAVVSVAATAAATVAFLIARYAARERVAALAARSKRFAAIDRAISKNGLKFVVLLRMSPLLPLAASNYLYGLTSVDLGSYVLGSWLGMLPGTYAYVTAGYVGKSVLEGSRSGGGDAAAAAAGSLFPSWQLGAALVGTAAALWFVGGLAKQAVDEADAEAAAEAAAELAAAADAVGEQKHLEDGPQQRHSGGGGGGGGGGGDAQQ